jgi:hypothetical protein
VAETKKGDPKITMRTVKVPVEPKDRPLREQLFINLSSLKKGEALEISGVPTKRDAYVRAQVSAFNKKSKSNMGVRSINGKLIVIQK